jgi:hypothetical protein
MIRIAITQAAFDAIARTMPFGSVNFEAGVDDKGERYIWLPRAVVDRLRSLRGPGESFSDVILRLAAEGELGAIWRIKPNQGRNTAANHDLAAAISLKPPVVRGRRGPFPSPQVLASEPLFLKAAASPAEV